MLWFSSTKPLMSAAIGQLVERGLVDFDDPVARHVPEFAANGKAGITLRHLLTHTAGIANAHRDWSRESWDEIVAKICAAAPEPGWRIGVDCGYHVASAWYVLGEIVRRRDGRTYDRYVREAILAPLGIADFWVGMSAADHGANAARIAPLLDITSGRPQPSAYWAWTGSAESVAICRPGGSGWGTARALAGFYAALLRGGAPILQADTVRRLTEPALRGARDRNFGVVLDRGLGVVLELGRVRPRLGVVRQSRLASSLRPLRLLLVGRVRRSRARPRGGARLELRRPHRKSTTRARTRRSTRCTRTSG